jgi:hypothetical protein
MQLYDESKGFYQAEKGRREMVGQKRGSSSSPRKARNNNGSVKWERSETIRNYNFK